jgi:hypothetical protein|eukprot:jgi/Chrpa1/9495/Chrysochromulina_OHIO_Genome00003681-RA
MPIEYGEELLGRHASWRRNRLESGHHGALDHSAIALRAADAAKAIIARKAHDDARKELKFAFSCSQSERCNRLCYQVDCVVVIIGIAVCKGRALEIGMLMAGLTGTATVSHPVTVPAHNIPISAVLASSEAVCTNVRLVGAFNCEQQRPFVQHDLSCKDSSRRKHA